MFKLEVIKMYSLLIINKINYCNIALYEVYIHKCVKYNIMTI